MAQSVHLHVANAEVLRVQILPTSLTTMIAKISKLYRENERTKNRQMIWVNWEILLDGTAIVYCIFLTYPL